MITFIRSFSFTITFLSAIGFFSLTPAQARWGEIADADIEYVTYDSVFDVKKDGTYTSTIHFEKKILTEGARRDHSVFLLTFDKSVRDIEIISAKTIVGDKEYPVPLESIEIKPLASDPIDICQNHQIIIPFPNVMVGAILSVEYKENSFYNEVPDYFAIDLFYMHNAIWRNSSVSINTELPLNLHVHDPRKNLVVSQSPKTFTIKNNKPIFERLIDESNNNHLAPEQLTHVSLSSEKDHTRSAKVLGEKYKSILEAPLPPLFENIAAQAKNIKGEQEQINFVISQLIHSIHYFSSSCTAEGKLIPRPLIDIVSSGYGDCKDYSVSLAKILRALGYQADVTAVERGDISFDLNSLPNLSAFNHVIVKAKSPSGTVYWLDPTNETAMAGGIYPDIADRPTLILHDTSPSYEQIPAINAEGSVRQFHQEITLNKDASTQTKGKLSFSGESAQPIVGLITSTPPSVVKDSIAYELSQTGNPKEVCIDLPQLETCSVVPLAMTYQFDETSMGSFTNLGFALNLSRNWAKPYTVVTDKNEGTLYAGVPETMTYTTLIKNVEANELKPLAYEISTPWLYAKRELKQTAEGVEIVEHVKRLKSIISAKELKSKEFKTLRDTLMKYCSNVAIVLQEMRS